MAQPVPYRWITGLPPEAQREIERNFLALQLQITGGAATLFDATIDPAGVNSATAHTYTNLTNLVAGETGWTSTRLLTVAVIGHTNAASVDTSPITLPGPLALVGGGLMGLYEASAPYNGLTRAAMDIRALVTSAYTVSLTNIEIYCGSGTLAQLFSSGVFLHMQHSQINGQNLDDATVRITSLGAGKTYAFDSHFFAIVPFLTADPQAYLFNTGFTWGAKGSFSITGDGTIIWQGGIYGVYAQSTQIITLAGTGHYYFDFTEGNRSTSWGGSVSGGSTGISVTTSGNTTIKANQLGTVTVSAGAGHCAMDIGFCAALTVSGNTSQRNRRFRVFITGGTAPVLDFTGPGIIEATFGSAVTDRSVLRGNAVQANLRFGAPHALTDMQAIALVHSTVRMSTATGTAGTKAYSFDAASHNNTLIISGLFSGHDVASTDAGFANRVISELGDSLIPGGTTGGVLAALANAGRPGEDAETIEGPPGPPGPPGLAPVGAMVIWSAAAAIPLGWRNCDGTTFLRSEPLFQVIGVTYGVGDGSTTANLPTTASVDPDLTDTLIIKL